MFLLLPITVYILLFLLCRRKDDSIRVSALSAAVFLGLIVTAITELLSLPEKLNFFGIAFTWAALAVLLTIIHFFLLPKKKPLEWARLYTMAPKPFPVSLYPLGLVLALTGLIALCAAPNTWDSMTYHMSRVAHWVQNQSVAHYETSILRQLYLTPGAEFAITQLQILTGGDQFANMVQWLSMLGSLIGVSLITKDLGGDSDAQVAALVFSGSLPMGILQSSSTQNDYVVTLWLICFVYFGLLLITRKSEHIRYYDSTRAGIALGLALLTKGTAYLYAAPFVVWFGISMLRQRGIPVVKPLVLLCAIVLALNLGHYSRQYKLYGNPLGTNDSYSNEVITVCSITSNVLRGLALHLESGFKSSTRFTESAIDRVHKLIGIDINDPRTTWPGTKFRMPCLSSHEDSAGNPAHLLLIFGSMISLLFVRFRPPLIGALYVLCVVVAFVLFSALLKWQPWHSRLQLPLFVLISPFVALQVKTVLGVKPLNIVSFVLVILSTYWVLHNDSRPVFGPRSIFTASRSSQYFRNRPEVKTPYEQTTSEALRLKCARVGLMLGGDDWEYPLWVLLNKNGASEVRISHVNVQNISKNITHQRSNAAAPDCIISSYAINQDSIVRGQTVYKKKESFGPLSVFVRSSSN